MEKFESQKNEKDRTNDLKSKYSQDLIQIVWERLASEGISNADAIIGTRSTIDNIDAEKFWKTVKPEDVENLIAGYERSKEGNLVKYNKYKNKADAIGFVAEIGEFINEEFLHEINSFYDNKIAEAKKLLSEINKNRS